jgi:hypothetical protein
MMKSNFPLKLLAVLGIAPFLLAFSSPEEHGTTVSVSGVGGRFISASGCSRPRLVESTDQQVGIQHQWAYQGDRQKRFGIGLDGNLAQSREKECAEEDCRNGEWSGNPLAMSLSPYGTLDWKWLGLKAGTQIPLHPVFADTFCQADADLFHRVPVRLRLAGRYYLDEINRTDRDWDSGDSLAEYRIRIPEYSAAAGLDYHLPL